MNLTISISIPYNLAEIAVKQRLLVNKYETNQVIKALDTWLVLKHLNVRFPHILNWNQQKKNILKICKISEAVFRHRLKILKQLQLLDYDKHITVCSWYQLGKIFGINIDKKFEIQYYTADKKRVQEWIIATEIVSNQSRQKIAIVRKLGSPENNKIINDHLSPEQREEARNTEWLLSWYKMQYINDFVQASPLHDLMIAIRPDIQRGVKGMKNAWSCKNICTISYWKSILSKVGIIDVTKVRIESQERVRNSECKVLWLDNIKQTLLCLCDQIIILQPWNRINLSLP